VPPCLQCRGPEEKANIERPMGPVRSATGVLSWSFVTPKRPVSGAFRDSRITSKI
jgi:hypothetical protein